MYDIKDIMNDERHLLTHEQALELVGCQPQLDLALEGLSSNYVAWYIESKID